MRCDVVVVWGGERDRTGQDRIGRDGINDRCQAMPFGILWQGIVTAAAEVAAGYQETKCPMISCKVG